MPAEILVPSDPTQGATSRYCDNLRRLVRLYGEPSVIAAIPSTFEGRAMDWFNSNTMSLDAMETVEGWIDALQNEFELNTAVGRERAKAQKYNPDVDKSVRDYF